MKPGNRKREKEKDGTRNQIFPIGRLIRSPSFSTDRFFKKNRSPITGFSLDPFGWIRWSKRFFGCRKHPHPVLIGWPPTGQWRGVWLCFFFQSLSSQSQLGCTVLFVVVVGVVAIQGFRRVQSISKRAWIGFSWVQFGVLWNCTGLDWVWSGLIRFYWVILGFTGFYWALLGFTGFYWVFTGFYWVLPSFSRFNWVLPSFTGLYWASLSFTWFY